MANPTTLTSDARTREQLVAAIESGSSPKYLFFWRHQPQGNGQIGAGVFSQWTPSPFTVDGVEYLTAEHWMMAGKARLFGDEESVPRILRARTPAEAQKLGRLVKDFDQDAWEAHRFELVVTGNVAKFGQDERLRDYLLRTGTRVLVEASPLDRIWGIGLAADSEQAISPSQWRGLNLLGFALMEARARLAN
ncbi:NADAR family protein [Kitasatospora sp. CB02891]|uniref:NADAR family protein n=1 Tax=Kitasatospora sp. CB02891 TaxID=2020329 RepID=UPI000C27F7D6|nr:NADAR family protein [Kitasatospora sp. CB02891]PJN26831.1 hypothetical protein CG736_09445 [Kitasatospora sp. CB02891]